MNYYLYTHAIGLPLGVELVEATTPIYFPKQTTYALSFKFKGGSLDNQPSFIPHFKLGVISEISVSHSNDIQNLLQAIRQKVSFIIQQLEFYFDSEFLKRLNS
jgi:hypothetical protein